MSFDGASQSVLSPAGTQASSIHHLWSLMFWVSAAVFAVVIAFVFVALVCGIRRLRSGGASTSEHALTRGVAAPTAVTVVILFGLLTASVWTGRTVASLRASSAVSIAVTGHQWWWEV